MPESQRLLIPALARLYDCLAPFTELLIRLVAGLSLAAHGYPILFRNTAGAARFFEGVGFTHGLFWAYVAGIVELVCGLCLALGLLTRVVAVPIIGFLLVAIVSYHWQFGFPWENRGFEYPLFWSIVVLHFLVHGGGKWSIDALIGREV